MAQMRYARTLFFIEQNFSHPTAMLKEPGWRVCPGQGLQAFLYEVVKMAVGNQDLRTGTRLRLAAEAPAFRNPPIRSFLFAFLVSAGVMAHDMTPRWSPPSSLGPVRSSRLKTQTAFVQVSRLGGSQCARRTCLGLDRILQRLV